VSAPAIVGWFDADAHHYQARSVDLEGQPTWTLGQLHLSWLHGCGRDTDRLCRQLLACDWSLLANLDATAWPAPGPRSPYRHVDAIGRGLYDSRPAPLRGAMPTDPATPGTRWAYLWEHAGGALHVYATARRRWHHLATLPTGLFAALTADLVVDVEARLDWLKEDQ
jgi:hypothetical protein